MFSSPRVSLEQWRVLLTVVEAGGYAQAAEHLSKSQSAVTYAIQKLQSQLGVRVFELSGRKAVLTTAGQALYRRAQALLEEAAAVERSAKAIAAGWEAELAIAAEIIFPAWLLLAVLARFGQDSPHTRIELIESVIGGTEEALVAGRVDLGIAPRVPPGLVGEPLMHTRMLLVAAPAHPLHAIGRALTLRDLRPHRQLVVRDGSSRRDARSSFMEARQRWTVSHMDTSIAAACAGHGFAWCPEDRIRDELAAGRLAPLPLREGGERTVPLYLVFADREAAGPGLLRLADLLRESTKRECALAARATETRM